MYKDILRSIAGIEVFPLLSLGLFVLIFALVVVWTIRLDRSRLARLSHLPLEDEHIAGPRMGAASDKGDSL